MVRGKGIYLILLLFIFLVGCGVGKKEVTITAVQPQIDIPEKKKEGKEVLQRVLTDERKMALTFNGLADEATMHDLLDNLSRLQVKATFFVQGMRVAEDPE